MQLFPKKGLESTIIELLQTKNWVIVNLISFLQDHKSNPTKQAIYQSIRKLKKSEIVIVANKTISLSSIWIDRMYNFFSIAQHAYQGGVFREDYSETFLNLEEGDKITYEFKNPVMTDIFWGNAVNLLAKQVPSNEPIYLYNPHQWFLLVRQEIELDLMHQSEAMGHPWFIYVPHTTPLDIYTKKLVKKPSILFTQAKHYYKENVYFNILGDFIIKVTLDKKTQHHIDTFFKTYSLWNEQSIHALKQIIESTRGRNILTIMRSKKNVVKYKKLFKKYFY
jgi:hypothetical protein